MKDLILLPERLFLLLYMRLGDLELHIRICDFRDVRHEEDKGKTEDEDGNGEINPLDALQSLDVIFSRREEDVGAEHGSDHGADGVEGLGQVDSNFGIFGWTAHWIR